MIEKYLLVESNNILQTILGKNIFDNQNMIKYVVFQNEENYLIEIFSKSNLEGNNMILFYNKTVRKLYFINNNEKYEFIQCIPDNKYLFKWINNLDYGFILKNSENNEYKILLLDILFKEHDDVDDDDDYDKFSEVFIEVHPVKDEVKRKFTKIINKTKNYHLIDLDYSNLKLKFNNNESLDQYFFQCVLNQNNSVHSIIFDVIINLDNKGMEKARFIFENNLLNNPFFRYYNYIYYVYKKYSPDNSKLFKDYYDVLNRNYQYKDSFIKLKFYPIFKNNDDLLQNFTNRFNDIIFYQDENMKNIVKSEDIVNKESVKINNSLGEYNDEDIINVNINERNYFFINKDREKLKSDILSKLYLKDIDLKQELNYEIFKETKVLYNQIINIISLENLSSLGDNQDLLKIYFHDSYINEFIKTRKEVNINKEVDVDTICNQVIDECNIKIEELNKNLFENELLENNTIMKILNNYELYYQLLEYKLLKETANKIIKNKEDSNSLFEIIEGIKITESLYSGPRTINIILFEILFGYFIRTEQYSIYKQIIDDIDNNLDNETKKPYKIHELLMGRGKTAVILPLVTFILFIFKKY